MPTLITTMPVQPQHLSVVHAAQTAGWKIIKAIGGRLDAADVGSQPALYGSAQAVMSIARMNRIHLLGPPAEWVASLPREFQGAAASIPTQSTQPEIPELVSTVRCFVSDRAVVTLSPMTHQGTSCWVHGKWSAPEEVSEAALEFCELLLRDPRVPLPPALVLDVAQGVDGDWFVINSESAWSAEIYSCSPSAVLITLLQSCTNAYPNCDEVDWLVE